MAIKFLALFVVAVALTQGQDLTEITLPDEYHTFMSNPFFGNTFGIIKSFQDTLVSCFITFPNGIPYEAFPNNRLPEGPITYLKSAEPFTSCAIGFMNAPVSASGTYELISTVLHSADNSRSLTRQRFHLTLYEMEPTTA